MRVETGRRRRSSCRGARVAGLALVLAAAVGASPAHDTRGPESPPPSSRAPAAVRVVVLGTAQDGGLPHAGCDCARCAAARRDGARARRVASLAIHVPESGRTYLVDATPDLGAQIEAIHAFRRHPEGRVDRAPVDGVLLTHAHIGHYLGLALFGVEALGTKDLPVHASPRMAAFLRASGPWRRLVDLGNVALREFEPGRVFALDDHVRVTPIRVPHRDEDSDTVGFVVRGPRRALLYVPDTDSWDAWSPAVTEVAKEVDYALVDATFYSADELPDRDLSKIRHPLVTASMDLFQPLVRAGRLRVCFTHFNHSNPVLDADGRVRREIEARGFTVLDDGDELEL